MLLIPWARLPQLGWPHPHAQWSDLVFGLAALAWTADRLRARDLLGWARERRLFSLLGACATYGAWALVSWTFSPRTTASLAHVFGVASLAGLTVMTAHVAQDPRVSALLARALVAGTSAAALLALAGVALFALGVETSLVGPYGDLEPGPYARARGPALHPNLLASVCLAGAALLGNTGWPRRVRRALWLLLALTLAGTLSRTVLTFALAALLRTRALARRPRTAALAVAAAAALVVALTSVNVRVPPTRPWAARVEEGLSPRAEGFLSSWATLRADPLTGRGPGTSPGRRGEMPFDAHCTPLNVAATMGLPALFALAAIPLFLARRASGTRARAEWSALVALGVDALAEDVEDFRHLWLLFGFVAAHTPPRAPRRPPGKARRAPRTRSSASERQRSEAGCICARGAGLDLGVALVHPFPPKDSMASAVRTRPRQLSLHFEDVPLWDAAGLEAALLRETSRPLRLTLTQNRSVLLSFRRKGGTVLLRLHRMFLHAPVAVVRAVARSLRRTSRAADGEVRRFMNENLHRVRRVPRPLPLLVTAGNVHDLRSVFDRLNQRFFAGKLEVPLTWGRGSGRARRGGLTFGSYDPVLGLIRIHPVLDRRDVPMYFLESVVYHEMLHHHMGGIPDRAGRTVYHSRPFREAEARYPWHRQALAWEKENLPHLLRASAEMDRRRKAEAAALRRA